MTLQDTENTYNNLLHNESRIFTSSLIGLCWQGHVTSHSRGLPEAWRELGDIAR